MKQSRLESLVESWMNTASGFIISWLTWLVVAPLYGYKQSASEATSITLIFTGISIVRSYFWRRFFNRRLKLTGGVK